MKSPAWQTKAGQNPKGGLNAKGRASYNKETGGNLKPPVKSGDNPRRASFLARMAGNALTLANGAQGQIKNIVYVAEAAGGDTGVLTPTNLGAGTTITFNAVGDACQLQYIGTDWWAVSLRGAVLA